MKRLPLADLHIYGGLAVAAAGLGLALGLGWGVLLFGVGSIAIGVILAATEPDEQPAQRPGDFSAMMTASPPADEEAA